VVAAVVLASAPLTLSTAHAVSNEPQPEFLFALNAGSGTSTKVGKDSGEKKFVLTLRGVSARATQFADRPFRNAYLLSTRTLIAKWDTWFHGSAPNAVLTFVPSKRVENPSPRTIVVKLLKPKYSPKSGTLRFTAQHLHRTVSPVNGAKVTLPKRRPPATFSRGSLFIDTVALPSASNGCSFTSYASCRDADFSDDALFGPADNSDFTGADFSRSSIGASFQKSVLDGAKFVDSVITDSSFAGASLVGADFTRARFDGALFDKAVLDDAVLTGATLREVAFTGALLRKANLSGADLRGTNLEGAVLTGASATAALTDSTTTCPNGSAGPCTSADQWRPGGPAGL
jgi:uncharacterized protein YjbI with pentapeptide repeats